MPPEKLLSCPLLRCPFCGSESELIDGPAGYFVLCNNTECDAGQVSKNWTKLAAVTQWNTRTPSPELVELRKDKERLDWLDKERQSHIYSHFKFNSSNAAMQKSWRTAIDAAKEKK